MGSRLKNAAVVAFLSFAIVAPTSLAHASPLANRLTTATSATPSPGSGSVGDSEKRPNVGDDAPGHQEFGDHRNLFTDESGLIALGLAALVGAATAVLVMRARRKSSLY